jgi:hypothetical protein
MRILLIISVLPLLLVSNGFSQDPMPILNSSWQRTVQTAQKNIVETTPGPARAVTNDDKYFQRKSREQRTDSPYDPNVTTEDGRRAAMEKAVQESRTPSLDDAAGYSYFTTVRNDSGKTVKIVFWEYRFTELARPTNIVRRHFVCSVNLKNGDSRQLSAFSLLAPSEVIDAQSLSSSNGKLFDEKVVVNRIEFSDGTFRQRGNFNYEEVKTAAERTTGTPRGGETCRVL